MHTSVSQSSVTAANATREDQENTLSSVTIGVSPTDEIREKEEDKSCPTESDEESSQEPVQDIPSRIEVLRIMISNK